MKIGIVCYPTLGGSGVVATELGHALASQGHEVHFITYEIPFRLRIDDQNIFFHQVEINRYDLFQYPDYALPLAVKMASVSKEFDLDILHVHYAIPHATSAYLAKQILGKEKPAVITTLHGTDITLVGREVAYFPVVKHSMEHSDGLTAVSHHLRQQTIDYFHLSNSIEVIPNFFTPRREFVCRKPVCSKFVNNKEKLLIHSSNFRSVKRPLDVIHIFLKVRKEVECKLLLLGTGLGIDEVREAVQKNKIEKDVFFLGKNREVDRYIAAADLLLLPSSQESFGLVALEAMAYGVPVVATNVGGVPEVVQDGETGYLSETGDITSMANHAIKLLTDPALYQHFSEKGRERARTHFSVGKVLPKYVAFYKKIINKLGNDIPFDDANLSS